MTAHWEDCITLVPPASLSFRRVLAVGQGIVEVLGVGLMPFSPGTYT